MWVISGRAKPKGGGIIGSSEVRSNLPPKSECCAGTVLSMTNIMLVPSPVLVSRSGAAPPADYPRNRATQQNIGNKRQQKSNDNRFGRMKRFEFDELVDHVHA